MDPILATVFFSTFTRRAPGLLDDPLDAPEQAPFARCFALLSRLRRRREAAPLHTRANPVRTRVISYEPVVRARPAKAR